MKQKTIIQIIALIIISGAGLMIMLSMIAAKPDVKKEELTELLKKVRTEKADFSPLTFDLVYEGRVGASGEVTISSEVSGKILKSNLQLREGVRFTEGQILLSIEDDVTRAALKAAKSTYLTNLASILPDLRIDFPDEYSKWANYFNAIDMDKDLPKIPSFNSDKEKVFLATKNLVSTYYNIVQQEITLRKHIIRAPFNGFITRVNLEPGSIANPGSPVATVIRADMLEIKVPVRVQDLQWLTTGMPCTIISNGINYDGQLNRIAGYVNSNTQMVDVFLNVNNHNAQLLEGAYVQAQFNIQRPDIQCMLLPREALTTDGKLFHVADGKLQKLDIDIIQTMDDAIYVNGFEPNKNIVVTSVLSPVIGEKVRVISNDRFDK